MAKDMETATPVKDITRKKIFEYIWARYVDNTKAPFLIDENDGLHFFEKFYGKHPLNEDEECFYYAILLYERAFSDDTNRARYLVKAKEVFEVYRNETGDTEWDVIEDRYADVCDLIESESLLDKVKMLEDLAPEIPGMVLVPSGPFPFGPEPRETVLESFYIDVEPVTNEKYKVFLEETSYRRPAIWDRKPEQAADNLPVTGVSWMDALQYCKWAKKSLPTTEQWEKAARGAEGRTYPWGEEEPTPERANFWDEIQAPKLLPVSEFTAGASPYGVLAMSGSVWEWTNTSHPEEDGAQYVRGGSYVDPGDPNQPYLTTTSQIWANKKEKSDIVGFRCTKSLEGQ